ncbi:adrenocortical dysplasia protein homolog [Anableps anableps]
MPPWSKLTPWIESLILSYGSREEAGSSGSQLRAHVIGVGQLTQSQARGSDGPTGLLFLSDGSLQIPAVLTASGWERLQEKEDRECFSSLLNTTVCLQDYRLQFHMDPEQTKSRFFLSVGELATTAAGPVKDNTPCCTSLASVRMKICRTWRSLLGQEDSQRSQGGQDLSELLGEWQHDCLQTLLRDVRERLMALRSPQASTSAHRPPPSCPTATGWDRDRVRYRGEPTFSVPVKLLLIPEGDVQRLEADAGGRGRTRGGAFSAEDAEWRDAGAADESSPPLMRDVAPLPDPTALLRSNPWDMFPPPGVSSSTSDSSPEPTPDLPRSKPDSVAVATGTQLPVHSFLPPYQNQPPSSLPPTSSSEPPASDGTDTPAALRARRGAAVPGSYRKPKRKRCEVTPEAAEAAEEVSGSPPSWLFDSQIGASGNEDGPKETRTAPRKTPSTHSDGRAFSYTYRVSGQNLQDFSRFRVAASLLHWAVRYLLTPQPAADPQSVD